ncbi:MAG: hypothetical protein HQK99_13935 [Nitrospirae bacterium]|nr:hypothetical protein [Nitrospirota bacterium]
MVAKQRLIETAAAILMLTLIVSCFEGSGGNAGGSSSSTVTVTSGNSGTVTTGSSVSHNQAKDCLLCHNTELQSSGNLIIGGTMYIASSVSSVDDLDNCYVDNSNATASSIRIQFVDNNSNVAVDSNNYIDSFSKGYNARGNLFILGRMMTTNLSGSYYIRLLNSNGVQIAGSNRTHNFLNDYSSTYPNDVNNRYSCNACHLSSPSGGAPGLIYPNMSHNQGKDCIQCHNTFPASDNRTLTVGGTFYSSVNDTSNVCIQSPRLQLLDDSNNVVYDTAAYMNAGISGNYGKGNFSIMSQSLASLKGSYFTRIMAPDGTILAASTLKHDFISSYDNITPADLFNRYSCNACHNTSPSFSAPGLLYPNVNSLKCQ